MSVENVLTSGVYQNYLSQKPNPLHPRYKALSDDQLVAVYAYTTNANINSYKDLNHQLRAKSIDKNQFTLIQAINGAISIIDKDVSAPIYFRFTPLKSNDVKKIYTSGRISTHNFFTSVSEEKKNFIDPKCNVLISIHPDPNITPAYIADISRFPEEKEYLYPPNTYFEVLQVIETKKSEFEILLLERKL